MRYKPVPEPVPLSTVDAIQRAVPLVPGSTDDCCARIVDRTTVASRDDARRWLTFLTALGLVDARDGRYVRTDRDPGEDAVAAAFRDNVYGVEELVSTIRAADTPLTVDMVLDRLDLMPRWERDRSTDPDRDWHTRLSHLLSWAVTFGLLEETATGYRLVTHRP